MELFIYILSAECVTSDGGSRLPSQSFNLKGIVFENLICCPHLIIEADTLTNCTLSHNHIVSFIQSHSKHFQTFWYRGTGCLIFTMIYIYIPTGHHRFSDTVTGNHNERKCFKVQSKGTIGRLSKVGATVYHT